MTSIVFLIRRILIAILLFTGIVCFTFVLFRLPTILWGASPFSIMLLDSLKRCGNNVTSEAINYLIANFGLVADPDVFDWIYMFGKFVANSFSGEFGLSFLTTRPVSLALQERVPNTLLLMISTIVISTIIITISKDRREKNQQKPKTMGLMNQRIGSSIPVFWPALILLLFFSFLLLEFTGIGFPQFGTISYDAWEFARNDQFGFLFLTLDILYHLFLPLTTLTLFSISSTNSISKMLSDVLSSSRSKESLNTVSSGNRPIVIRYDILKAVGSLLGATILIEVVFNWRGLGRLFFDSLLLMDFPVLQACFIVFGALIIIINLFTDLGIFYVGSSKFSNLPNVLSAIEQELFKTRMIFFLLFGKIREGVDPPQMVKGGTLFSIGVRLRDHLPARLQSSTHPLQADVP
ncbi:MAG: ABC transporter permease subunit [Candidatus Thorarchaeota archaeon]